MQAYAVIEAGGKQYMVRPGDVVRIEKLDAAEGARVELQPVLALRTNEAEFFVGSPTVEGATVVATVTRQLRGPKVVAFKKKRRKGYRRKVGHRQPLTELKIEEIKAARSGRE